MVQGTRYVDVHRTEIFLNPQYAYRYIPLCMVWCGVRVCVPRSLQVSTQYAHRLTTVSQSIDSLPIHTPVRSHAQSAVSCADKRSS